MSFMKPQIEQVRITEGDEYWVCPDCLMSLVNADESGASEDWPGIPDDTPYLVPADDEDRPETMPQEFSTSDCDCCGDYRAGTRHLMLDFDSIEHRDQYRCRLSASGYLDCTDWHYADTLAEAMQDIASDFGDEFDVDSWRELFSYVGFDFADCWVSYLLALGFTAHRQESEDSETEPAFSCQGEFSDSYSSHDIAETITDDDQRELMGSLVDFLLQSMPGDPDDRMVAQIVSENPGRAGSDFHLSRNRHGSGFWDGSWPEHGQALHDLSTPFGSCELLFFGDNKTADVMG